MHMQYIIFLYIFFFIELRSQYIQSATTILELKRHVSCCYWCMIDTFVGYSCTMHVTTG